MSHWVVEQLVLEMARNGHVIAGAKVLILGLSFKENCPDLRNTQVVDVITGLQKYMMEPVLWILGLIRMARHEYKSAVPVGSRFHAVIAAVAHREFVNFTEANWQELMQNDNKCVLLDLKGVMPRTLQPLRL